jgi:hypothetical protein
MILPPPGHVVTEVAEALPPYLTVPGMDPRSFCNDGTFLVSTAMLLHLEANGPTQKFADANLISDAFALEHPSVILEGLKRTNFHDALCYCTVPRLRWVFDDGGNLDYIKPLAGTVFAVYVNPQNGELFVMDWDWRIVGPDATGIPHKWHRDFERIAWPPS